MVFRKLLPYLASFVISLAIILVVFALFKIDPTIPLNFSGDAIVHYNFAKNMEQTGWWFTNPAFGAPGQQTLYDFPLTENLQLLLLKFLMLIGFNWYMGVNIFFILTFPLTAVIALYVLKKFDIKTSIALPLSIIYTFIPYHFYRGVNHLFLAAYFTVPISILIAYTLASGKKLNKINLLLASLVIASSGAYYTFFSCYFILVGLILGVYKTQSKKLAVNGLLLIISIFFFFALNLLPTIIYQSKHGQILNTTVRSPRDTEVYGMKIIQLLLPVEDHNLKFFNKIYKQYEVNGYTDTINENQYSSLGLISTIGFLILIFWSLFGHKLSVQASILSSLNLAAILFATTGGFSLIVSTYINPTFRSINRISIFIAFFAVAALGLLLQNMENKKKASILAWLILPIALFDQISFGTMRNFTNKKTDFDKLQSYSKQIDTEKTKIYALPFGQYPEGNEKKIMKLALLTENVMWGVGAPAWRASNYWQYKLSQMDTKPFLENIVNNDFNGLLIYTPGYDAQKLIEFDQLISTPPITDFANEFRYYDLKDFAKTRPHENFLYYVSGNCLHNYNRDKLTRYWCVNSLRIELENKTEKSLSKILRITAEYPESGVTEINRQIAIPVGNSHIIINKPESEKGVFPIPRNEITWPFHMGYPNIIVDVLEIVDY